MKQFKKLHYFIFSLLIIISLSSCGKDKSTTNKVAVDTKSLINNIIEKQEASKKLTNDESLENKEIEENTKDKNNKKSKTKDKAKKKSNLEIKTLKIKAFGDIMGHEGQVLYAKNKGNGEYDFSDQFIYLKDFVSDSDISIANYEATSNPNINLSGYPRFNLPVSYPKYIKDAGFDILTTANNHSLDSGEEGVFTTIKAIEDVGLSHVGTQKEDESRILYKTVNDIKIAFLSYTYGANGLENNVVNYDVNKILNFLDEELIQKDIKIAKNNNADFVIIYPHWGYEYQSYPDQSQIELGRKMIDWGADIVIGNHPHVVQPAEFYETEDGRRGFIAYSLGNMISEQSYETIGDIRTEQSVAYEIDISKYINSDYTNIDNVKAYPLWVGKTYNEYGSSVRTYIVKDFLQDGKYASEVNENQIKRLEQAQEMVDKTVTTNVEIRK